MRINFNPDFMMYEPCSSFFPFNYDYVNTVDFYSAYSR